MIGLVAYLALVVTLPALLLGHQGEDFPPLRWWRWARARQGPEPPRRHIPHWAHTQPLDPGDGRTPAPDRS